MTDIVERLRERDKLKYGSPCRCGGDHVCIEHADLWEAAAEITRLRAELAKRDEIINAAVGFYEAQQKWMSADKTDPRLNSIFFKKYSKQDALMAALKDWKP